MKKLIICLIGLIIFFACATDNIALAKKAKLQVTKHKIEFVTKDRYILVGDLYLAKHASNKPLVVMLHSFGVNSKVWKELAEELRLKDYNCLAMDLRGHGRSIYTERLKRKSRYKFKASDWQKLPNDVIESINYVKANYSKINTNNIIFIGADIGASAEIIAGNSLKTKPEKFVLISPMTNFKGLYIPKAISEYKTTKFLILLAQSDKILFNLDSRPAPIKIEYTIGGPGNQLLKANPQSKQTIINFILN